MLGILIVEDEIGILALLKNLINFEKLGVELIGTATNGKQALRIMQEIDPDIVITDICMPEMGGLELIESAQQQGISAKFIIVSGYSQFDYAVTAIKLGVKDYLLKPISEVELNSVLENLIFTIESENNAAHSLQMMNHHMVEQRKKLRKTLFTDLLFNNAIFRDRSLEEINTEYGYSFVGDFLFFCGLVQLDRHQDWNLVAKKILIEQMIRLMNQRMEQLCIEQEYYIYNDSFIWLLNVDENNKPDVRNEIRSLQNIFVQMAGQHEGVEVTMACGETVTHCGEIGRSLLSAERAMTCRILKGGGKMYDADDFSDRWDEQRVNDRLLKYRMKLQSYISSEGKKNLPGITRKYIEKVIELAEDQPQFLMETLERGVYYLLLDMRQCKIIDCDVSTVYRKIRDDMCKCSFREELTTEVLQQITEQFPGNLEEDESDSTQVMKVAKEYIEEHFAENLKLEDVAEQVYLAPNYFGVLFKKEMGCTFSAYLIQLRIEKAKGLLKSVQYNVSEIANMVGYQDVRHFSRLFKEHVGLVPKEYRKIHNHNLF